MNRLDELIDGLLDHEADADDVVELSRLVERDEENRRRLDVALASERRLRAGTTAVATIATRVELPPAARAPFGWPGAWSGWVAAAVLGIAAIASWTTHRPPAPRPDPAALPVATAPATGDPLDRYLHAAVESGRIIRELPLVTLEVRPDPGGAGMRVLYVRRLVEQATVTDVFRLGHTEHGRPVVVPAATRALVGRQTL